MKNLKGFTLVELVIVIVIVGILSIVAVPIYRGYVEKSKLTEAKALTGSILSAQRVYFAEHGNWHVVSAWTDYDDVLTIDARGYKYFNKVKTDHSTQYPGALETVARSDSQNIEVYQYWPAVPGSTMTLPRWTVINLNSGKIDVDW